MLVSIAIDPSCFGGNVVKDVETKVAAEQILAALGSNAVALCALENEWVSELVSEATKLNATNTKLGQSLQIRVEELLKLRRLSTVALNRRIKGSQLQRIRQISSLLRADIAVCANATEAVTLRGLVDETIEVCELRDYSNSDSEFKRAVWSEPQDLNNMDSMLAASIIGRSVKYAKKIEIVDPHIGKRARDGRQTTQLKKTAEAILFVAEQWIDSSPYSTNNGINITVITKGGQVGAGGIIFPEKAGPAIELALRDCDRKGLIGKSQVIFKKDSEPSKFRARFIRAGQHCWSIGHEISDLRQLKKPPGQRGDFFIERDCKLFRKLVCDIYDLPNA